MSFLVLEVEYWKYRPILVQIVMSCVESDFFVIAPFFQIEIVNFQTINLSEKNNFKMKILSDGKFMVQ